MIRSLTALVALTAFSSGTPAYPATVTTDLHGKACKILSFDRETGAATRQCQGVAGYKLLVHDEDGRTSIDVVPPARRNLPLNFWDVVSSGYSTVGRKAEWHMVKRNGKLVPVGLVVRVNTVDTVADRSRRGALTTVTRIAEDGACVVFKTNAASRQASRKVRAAALDPRAQCLPAVQS
ncbi:hypothetical protein ACFSQU_13370 [Massilia sp. GCM10020059]|uniref:Uncharacterized protein n=1 Tax=Massilia agrisoli TaxID=2892444 RepID=A0ABS8IW35_9BURK|nr:hypothetical protein [Massilia agrisoli]MCC6072749.1 hypothetical protein [Massilia agrisoli]